MVEKVENVRVIKGSILLPYHYAKNSTEKKSSYNYIEGMSDKAYQVRPLETISLALNEFED